MRSLSKLLILSAALLLGACADSSLTSQDRLILAKMRQGIQRDRNVDPTYLLNQLVLSTPEKVAEKAVQKGDFRLISIGMGYPADSGQEQEELPRPAFVACDSQVEIQEIAFGCMLPPPMIFKLIRRYNTALIAHEKFSLRGHCEVDEADFAFVRDWEKDFDIMIANDAAEAREKWLAKQKKTYPYNN